MAGEFATGSIQDDDALSDAALWGLSEDEVDGVRETLGRQLGQKLWAQHLEAMRALMAAGTQWRTRLLLTRAGLTERVVGLDYGGLKVALDMLGLTLSAESFRQLGVLERAAAAAFNGEPAPIVGSI